MSYLSETGNLTGVPELRRSPKGTLWCRAVVIHNYRVQDSEGEWHDSAKIAYDVIVRGRAAQELVHTARTSGNIKIHFEGRYRVKGFTRNNGTTGIAYEVVADDWHIARGQYVVLDPASTDDLDTPQDACLDTPQDAGAESVAGAALCREALDRSGTWNEADTRK